MKRFCNFIAVSIFLVCLLNSTLFVSAQQNTTYFKYTTTDNNSTIIFQKSANVLINGHIPPPTIIQRLFSKRVQMF